MAAQAGEAFSCSPKQYLRSAALGFLNPFLYYLVLFEAYDRLPAQEAQPLNYMWPIVVVILSAPLLKQPIGRVSLAGIAVSFFGECCSRAHGAHLTSVIRRMHS